MLGNISLNASMRANLLSLQQTAKLQDITQNRLTTGLKVSSAVDNASSYYTAQALNNRAKDLSALLDSMGQAIQNIKAAEEGLTTITGFVEQATSIVNQAVDAPSEIAAIVKNEKELLEAINLQRPGLIVIDGQITLSENQTLNLAKGQSLVGKEYLNGASGTKSTINIKISDGIARSAISLQGDAVVSDLIINFESNVLENGANSSVGVVDFSRTSNAVLKNVDINSDFSAAAYNESNNFANILATGSKLTLSGNNNIKSIGQSRNYGVFGNDLTFDKDSTTNISTSGFAGIGLFLRQGTTNLNGSAQLNILTEGSKSHGIFASESNFNLNDNSQVNIKTKGSSTNSLYSIKINMNGQAKLNALSESTANSISFVKVNLKMNSADNKVNLLTKSVNTFYSDIYITAVAGAQIATSSGLYTSNTNQMNPFFISSGNSLAAAPEFDENTGGKLTAMDSDFNDIFNNFMAGSSKVSIGKDINDSQMKVLGSQYLETLKQIDMVTNDSGYKGVNLLKENSLKVNFNENRSATLQIEGVDASSKGIGLSNAEWNSFNDIYNSLNELKDALDKLRSYTSEFGNYYSIVTAREDFTTNLINVLTEGADKLVLADMNEESANMLALQTRQQLAVNSLSLASQASQSVLRLF